MKCINCGKETPLSKTRPVFGFQVCNSCAELAAKLDAMLDDGIKVEYLDGTSELLTKQEE